MLNEKRAGMPIPKQRPMPRIVAGTDLMAALKQSIEKRRTKRQRWPPNKRRRRPQPPQQSPPRLPKASAPAKGSSDQREMLLPIAGGAPAKEAGGVAKEAPEKQAAQKPGARKKAG